MNGKSLRQPRPDERRRPRSSRGAWTIVAIFAVGGAVLAGLAGLTVLVDNDPAGWRALAEVQSRYRAADVEVITVASAAAREDLNDIAGAP